MKLSLLKGVSFGLTSGIITTLGLMVGLHSSTHSETVVIGGILTIAIADALSDALGMHISEEAENKHSTREVWESTIATFAAKLIFALTFVVPVLLAPLDLAIWISIGWAFTILGIISYFMAKNQNSKPSHVIAEHLVITALVITATHYVGEFIAKTFA